MAWFDKFFVLSKKKTILFEAKQLCFYFYWFDSFYQKFVRSQNFEVGIGSQTHEICLSRLIKQTNVEKF